MKRQQSSLKIMGRLIGLVKPLSGFMCIAIFLGVIGFLCAIQITVTGSLTLLSAAGLDGGIDVKTGAIFLIVFAVLRGFLHYGEQACNHFIAFKLLALIRDKVFRAMRRLAPAKLEGKDKGDLISLITSDIELLEVFYAHTISPICIAVLTCIIMLIFIGRYSIYLALVALIAYILVGAVVPLIASKFNEDDGMSYRTTAGSLSGYLLDSMRGLLETLRYNTTANRKDGMNKKTDELNSLSKKLKAGEGKTAAITDAVIILSGFAMLLVALLLKNKGIITGADGVVVPVVAMMSSFGPVAALSALSSSLSQTLASGERVLAILDEEPVTKDVENGKDVEFENMNLDKVGFSYDKETILEDFSMNIGQGKIVSITGPSGSGKSTALKLMMRFWETNKGSISMNGTNINEVNTKSLRSNQALCMQETELFNDSIASNIRIAKADATDEEVMEAAKKASVHDFIMTLPKQYDTNVGELGDLLSDGEKQRIGLARAFLANSPMIMLDEPTSNLDALNEGRILASLLKHKENHSIILISHRQSTSKIADESYTVYRGRLS